MSDVKTKDSGRIIIFSKLIPFPALTDLCRRGRVYKGFVRDNA